MRAALLIVALVWVGAGAARAAPPATTADPTAARSADPTWRAAVALWTTAHGETDPTRQAERWQAAAIAFDQIVDAGTVDAALRIEAALAAFRAWSQATRDPPGHPPKLDDADDAEPTPRPLDDRAQHAVHAAQRYLDLAGDAGADAAGVRFLRASLLRRFDHLDLAQADYEQIVANHRDAEVAEYAANLLLDTLDRRHRYDELVATATRLRADADFMRRAPVLAATATKIVAQGLRKRAEDAERAARAGDPDGFDRCVAIYQQLLDLEPHGDRADEVVYNAAICAQLSHDLDGAIARLEALPRAFPRSPLVARAIARAAYLHASIAQYAEAAAGYEQYARRYPAEKDAHDALSDATFYRRALGDLDAAEKDAALAARTYGARHPELAIQPLAALAGARLARDAPGDRKAAARLLTALTARAREPDPARALALAELLWDAACPVVPTAGLCLAKGKPVARDPTLAKRAQSLAARQSSPRARRLDADRRLEAALAIARPSLALGAAAQAAAHAYDAILADPGVDPDTAIAAHAGRGRLVHHVDDVTRDPDLAADDDLGACRDLAIATLRPTPWLDVCDPVGRVAELRAAPRGSVAVDLAPPPTRQAW